MDVSAGAQFTGHMRAESLTTIYIGIPNGVLEIVSAKQAALPEWYTYDKVALAWGLFISTQQRTTDADVWHL